MNIPFFDLKRQYADLRDEVEPALLSLLPGCGYIGGSAVASFEEELRTYLGVNHAVSCASGTDALVLALRACGVRPGDEVITTPFTFFATAEAIASVGAVPVFVDIRYEDFTLDPTKIEAAITPKTRAILPVHIFGAPCDMEAICAIAKQHKLSVIEDAAQAIGCIYHGAHIGTTADVSCFSFYPTKNLGAMGDGGMVTTNRQDLNTILRALKDHGAGEIGVQARELLEKEVLPRTQLQSTNSSYDPYKYLNSLIGYNSRLDAVQAAILSIKLRHLPAYNRRRAEIAEMYHQGLSSQVVKPHAVGDGVHCWHQYVIRTKKKEELCAFLNEKGIGVGTFYPIPLHLQPAFFSLGYHKGDLPQAEEAAQETVCLPIFPELEEKEIQYIIDTVNGFFQKK